MSESYVQVPVDASGKKLRTRKNVIGTDEVHSEVVVLEDGNGNLIDPRNIRTITETLNINNPSNLDVTLSTRASEATLSAIKSALASVGTDKLRTSIIDSLPAGTNTIGNVNAIKSGTWNIDNLLNPHPVSLSSIPNPSNLDVALSTRASESTLSAIKNALASVGTDKLRASIVDALPSGTNTIGSVTQATRTNLKVQIEREDIVTKSWDLTAGTTTLLSAVSGQKHKIYGWDYEADTDGANEFSATVGGSTVKFGRRITKGVHAMSLVHPIICDVNTALSFVSAGNTKLSLRYITEA